MKLRNDLGKILAVTIIGGLSLGACGSEGHNIKTPTVSNPITQTNKTTEESKKSTPPATNNTNSNSSKKATENTTKAIKKIDESAKVAAEEADKKAKIVEAQKTEAARKAKVAANKTTLKSSQEVNGGKTKYSKYYNPNNSLKSSGGAKYYTTSSATGSKYREVPKSTPVSARPISITISSIGVNNATILSRGLTGGVLAPPSGYVQWYTGSVKPGNNGISVLAGHVTYNGPDVLYNLGRTPIGAKITIHFSNGVSKSFTVKRRGTVNKNTLRYDQSVWGYSSTPKLVIISCDKYSAWAGLHHVNNYIIWAE